MENVANNVRACLSILATSFLISYFVCMYIIFCATENRMIKKLEIEKTNQSPLLIGD